MSLMGLPFFERSLHVIAMNDLPVTSDKRSQGKFWALVFLYISRATIFGGALVLMSINRQVRLGDFLFTGE